MVDEFQDTNDAQMRFINLLTEANVNEGRPNIMVVGDDDQAIFKFQGAEISNILKFKDQYRNPKIITLRKNYRSYQNILDVARHIILQGDERLENIVEEINKELDSKKEGNNHEIVNKIFSTQAHEYYWVAKEIDKLIKKGKEPEDIAVISRNHKYLKELVPYLNYFGIPINYEKQRDVLEEFHVKQLIQISRFVVSLIDSKNKDADYLLSEILSYPFLDINREAIWGLSREAYKNRESWIYCMKKSKNSKIKKIADFLIDLSVYAKHQPLENVLDKIVGAKTYKVSDSEDEDIDVDSKDINDHGSFVSPFKNYYFSHNKFEENPAAYIVFLSSLRTFIYALREYKQGQTLYLNDLVEFVDIHKDNKMSLPDNSVFVNAQNAVNLLSVHKAKGMEFDAVFVISCQDKIWAKKHWGGQLSFPKNLPIKPAGDTKDDQLRLFYVAITRVSENLYLTSYELDNFGKEVSRLEFLEYSDEDNLKDILKLDINKESLSKTNIEEEILSSSWGSYRLPPFKKGERILLETVLKNYKLNVTHFNNFLNIVDGGPKMFFEQNLLRFPQPKTTSLSYGTSMHKTIHEIYIYLKNKGKMPLLSQVLGWFKKFLDFERLGEDDFRVCLNKGRNSLSIFYKKRKKDFDVDHFSEFNFRNEEVVWKDVPLSGKIDKIVLENNKVIVYDFKTGLPVDDWKGKNKYGKIKLWKYKNQLIFYKILIENSRKFESYKVSKGVLEFLEPVEKTIINLPLEIKDEDVNRVKKLILKVYKKIMDLDFPDVSNYQKNIKGIKKFEEDILN